MALAIPTSTPKELEAKAQSLVQNDPAALAVKFANATAAVLAALNEQGIDAISHECLRSDELARIYHALGVSNATDATHTWHHYGLARDIISKSRGWDVYPERDAAGNLHGGDPKWYVPVWQAFRDAGLSLGADWVHFFDAPHVQWGKCPAKVPPEAIALVNDLPAVWTMYSAC